MAFWKNNPCYPGCGCSEHDRTPSPKPILPPIRLIRESDKIPIPKGPSVEVIREGEIRMGAARKTIRADEAAEVLRWALENNKGSVETRMLVSYGLVKLGFNPDQTKEGLDAAFSETTNEIDDSDVSYDHPCDCGCNGACR